VLCRVHRSTIGRTESCRLDGRATCSVEPWTTRWATPRAVRKSVKRYVDVELKRHVCRCVVVKLSHMSMRIGLPRCVDGTEGVTVKSDQSVVVLHHFRLGRSIGFQAAVSASIWCFWWKASCRVLTSAHSKPMVRCLQRIVNTDKTSVWYIGRLESSVRRSWISVLETS